MEFSSKLLEKAVDELASLPGIGKRTALRLVLYMLKRPQEQMLHLSNVISELASNVVYCQKCHNISDNQECDICSNPNRDATMICVVEDVRDVMAIENTGHFKGVYHVLGGKISPIDGVGPSALNIDSLIKKVRTGEVKEVIFALSPTMEGDTTNFYVYRQIKDAQVVFSTIARGISVGDELEFADEITLGRSIQKRIPFEISL
ncbi:MAG: recombination mediator RecR [Bacteroidota bacterium]|nr:recombination mediator RecR [Bacteroidota bacterium]